MKYCLIQFHFLNDFWEYHSENNYCIHGNIHPPFYPPPLSLVSGRISDWKIQNNFHIITVLIRKSIYFLYCVWVNLRLGKMDCKCRKVKITRAENNPVYSTHGTVDILPCRPLLWHTFEWPRITVDVHLLSNLLIKMTNMKKEHIAIYIFDKI